MAARHGRTVQVYDVKQLIRVLSQLGEQGWLLCLLDQSQTRTGRAVPIGGREAAALRVSRCRREREKKRERGRSQARLLYPFFSLRAWGGQPAKPAV